MEKNKDSLCERKSQSLSVAGRAVFNTILVVECAAEAQQACPLLYVCVCVYGDHASSAKTVPCATPPMEHFIYKLSLEEKNRYLCANGH